MNEHAAGPAAGWYPDPNDAASQRYWDGARWTEDRAPMAQSPAQTKTNGYAIASLVLGILWIYWVGSALALYFGYAARKQIDASGGTQGGWGLATAGIVLGWVGVAALSFVLLFLVAGVE